MDRVTAALRAGVSVKWSGVHQQLFLPPYADTDKILSRKNYETLVCPRDKGVIGLLGHARMMSTWVGSFVLANRGSGSWCLIPHHSLGWRPPGDIGTGYPQNLMHLGQRVIILDHRFKLALAIGNN